MKKTILILLLLLIVVPLIAQKKNSEFRTILHLSKKLCEKTDFYIKVLTPDVIGSSETVFWAGLKFNFSKHFSLAVIPGRMFEKEGNETWKISLHPSFFFGPFAVISEFDYNINFNDFFHLTLIRYAFGDFSFGIDYESVYGKDGFESIGPAVSVAMFDDKFSMGLAYIFMLGEDTQFIRVTALLELGEGR